MSHKLYFLRLSQKLNGPVRPAECKPYLRPSILADSVKREGQMSSKCNHSWRSPYNAYSCQVTPISGQFFFFLRTSMLTRTDKQYHRFAGALDKIKAGV